MINTSYDNTKRVPVDDTLVSEKDKSGEAYLQAQIDHYISELVQEKHHIQKSRDLYDGKRDMGEFQYLEDTYGVSAFGLKMTPIVRPRINALIGAMINEDIRFLVHCSDTETIDLIEQERKDKFIQDLEDLVIAQTKDNNQQMEKGKEDTTPSYLNDTAMQSLQKKYGSSFKSDFEIAAYNLIRFLEFSSVFNFETKKEQWAEDLLVTGEAYYREYVNEIGADPKVEVVKPENIFYNSNSNIKDLSECDAVVNREFMSKKQILNKYGHYMSKENIEDLFCGESDVIGGKRWDNSFVDTRDYEDVDDILERQFTATDNGVIEVYHVEWLAYNKVEVEDTESLQSTDADVKHFRWRQDRYEGVRIGDIYINCGKSKFISRSKNAPYKASFTYNGIRYKGRNGRAMSMCSQLKDIQDMYDLIIFYRDNLIAASGIDSSRINIAAIPTVLGETFDDRLMKFLSYRKTAGIELVDPTQPGAGDFNHYGVSKNSIDSNLVVSIDTILQTIEKQADVIAGTNPQMLAQIEQRDAVSNVKAGIQQTMLINKSLFVTMSTHIKNVYMDFIDAAKISYSKGKRGSYVVGSSNYIFNIDPKKFTFSDYTVSIIDASKELVKLDGLKQVLIQLAQSGGLSADVLVKAMLSDNPSEISEVVTKAVQDANQSSQQIQQLTQAQQQAEQQSKEMQKQLQSLQASLDKAKADSDELKRKEVEIKEKDVVSKYALKEKELQQTSDKNREDLSLKRETVQLEREQLYMDTGSGGGNSKEVRNDIV